MKRALKIIAIVVVLGLVVIQFFPIDKSVPPTVAAQAAERVVNIPPDVAAILDRSCSDCHSNNTRYPWYANVQPFGWFLKDHINDGRRNLNLSEFGSYAPKRQAKKLEEVCDQVQAREMPLPSYLWIHRDAQLTDAEIKTLCDWSNGEASKIPGVE